MVSVTEKAYRCTLHLHTFFTHCYQFGRVIIGSLTVYFNHRKRENKDKQHDDGPYVKQPPNAFMIFMSMQRATVPEEIKEQGSAAVSVYLGDEVSVRSLR